MGLWVRIPVGLIGKEVHDGRIRGILVGVTGAVTGAVTGTRAGAGAGTQAGTGRVEVIVRLAGALFGQSLGGAARADDIGEQDLVKFFMFKRSSTKGAREWFHLITQQA